jgi:hypothetical protein
VSAPPLLVDWVVTYALHSTILLGLVLLVSRLLESDAWRETLWKTALLGGLLTATLQTGAGYTPLVGRWALGGDPAAPPPNAPLARPDGRTAGRLPEPREERPADEPVRRTGGAAEPGRGPAPPAASGPGAELPERGTPWVTLLVGAWLAGAGLLLGRLALRHVSLFRVLADRRPVTDGALPGMLAALRRHAGFWAPVRLTASAACPTPLALGRREICVPERFLTELEGDQQRSALAHELAHLRRGDPVWQLAAGILESVFFFQPLNRVARQHLRDAAENLCDDWAVRHTGSPLGLARCLTDIAAWVSPITVPEATLAMAEGGSPLLRRVERLAGWKEPPMYAARFRSLASAGLLAAVALVAPAVSQRVPSSGAPALSADAAAPRAGSPARARDSVVVHPDPSAPLAERWSWALARGPRGGFWVAWGTEGPGRAVFPGGSFPVSSNSPGAGAHARDAPPLQQILAGSGASVSPVAFLFGFGGEGRPSGEVRSVRLRASAAPLDLGGRPLLWLGGAGARESLAQLHRLRATLGDPALRKEVAAALALHGEESEAVRAVARVIEEDRSAEVRAEAVQWLPRAHPQSEAAVALLLRVALEDPAKEVRLEAVDALAALRSASAGRALVRIAETHPDWSARSEAAQVLARRGR